MSAYVFDGRRCHVCLFRRDEYRHLKVCVPQRYWPPQSEWADFRPVVEKTPKTVGKYPYEVYAQAFSTVLSQPVAAYRAPGGVDNQTIYVEPVCSVCGGSVQERSALIDGQHYCRAHIRVAYAVLTGKANAAIADELGYAPDLAVTIGQPEPWPSPAETWGEPVRISHGEEIVVGPYERPAPTGPVCDVCGRIFKHAGALTGHKRTHREVTA